MNRSYRLIPIAETGEQFSDFRPYVAAINAQGTVALQARLADGSTGVFTGESGSVGAIECGLGWLITEVISHPDIDSEGRVSFYAKRVGGGLALVLCDGDGPVLLASSPEDFTSIGPLGPTMNDAGNIAFRATTLEGDAAVLVADRHTVELVARASSSHDAFEGLPVIDHAGAVAFRSVLDDGSHGIFLGRDDAPRCVVHTRDAFRELGRFPCLNDAGTVGFVATLRGGGCGVFTMKGDDLTVVVDPEDGFEETRGVLLDGEDRAVFYATPKGGALGIYAGSGAFPYRIVGVGDSCLGSRVSAFALNPVSINRRGQLAIRLELDDGRQVIVRADPSDPSM